MRELFAIGQFLPTRAKPLPAGNGSSRSFAKEALLFLTISRMRCWSSTTIRGRVLYLGELYQTLADHYAENDAADDIALT